MVRVGKLAPRAFRRKHLDYAANKIRAKEKRQTTPGDSSSRKAGGAPKWFRFCRDYGGFADDGGSFRAAIEFSGESELRATAFAQKLILHETLEGVGYKDARGRIVIAPRFIRAGDFTREGLAAVVDEQGWALIDRAVRVVVRTPFLHDGGPDDFSENLARLTDGGKISFYNRRGRIVIAPRFDFALPFVLSRRAVLRIMFVSI